MDQAQLNWITNFIWGIADDCLRDVFVRGKYRDVILPMTVLRRLDAVLEPTKQAVLDMKAALDKEKITNQDDALRSASGEAFYNTSPFAWLVAADTKIGYEVSFTRHFYQPPQLRTLAEISADILALEQEMEGLIQEITKGATV
jgi:type I restriction-modification system DNA methylase subunit